MTRADLVALAEALSRRGRSVEVFTVDRIPTLRVVGRSGSTRAEVTATPRGLAVRGLPPAVVADVSTVEVVAEAIHRALRGGG